MSICSNIAAFMVELFKDFDFRLLDDPDFREDSVREELIVPLLNALGYSASPPHQILRGKRLEHPYVYIGTVQKPVTIIPDYVLQRDGQIAWILDAKGPNETIDSGKNVEQAYSYAIHKDVRVPLYALCNGRRLAVFHINEWPAVLDARLQDLGEIWPLLVDVLGTRAAWPAGIRPGFLPDFGLALMKAGLTADEKTGKKIFQMFTSIPVTSVAKARDDLFVITGFVRHEDTATHMITFDVTGSQYEEFLKAVEPPETREVIRAALKAMPYQIYLGGPPGPASVTVDSLPSVAVVAEISDKVITNENESFCPFLVEQFI